jgi:hypothetical protein
MRDEPPAGPPFAGLPDGTTTATTSKRAAGAQPAVLPSPCASEVPCDGYAWFTDMSDDGTTPALARVTLSNAVAEPSPASLTPSTAPVIRHPYR